MLSSRLFARFCVAMLFAAPMASPAQSSADNPKNAATSPSSSPAEHYAFEVVSIHPTPPQQTFMNFEQTADGFRATGIRLDHVILMAYFPLSLWSPERIQNVPGWATKERYDINAKVAPQDLGAWAKQSRAEPTVLRAMLLSMLEERCHLELHTVPGEMPGFALAVSRGGTSLHASKPGDTYPDSMRLTNGGVAIWERLEDRSTTWHFHDAPIASLTNFLSGIAHTRVLDKTGLSGRYDFALAMLPDRVPSAGQITDPATFWDLRALGLRTVSTKVPTITLVIDHIDPPSEN